MKRSCQRCGHVPSVSHIFTSSGLLNYASVILCPSCARTLSHQIRSFLSDLGSPQPKGPKVPKLRVISYDEE